ncbi:MAG: hypothetical protein V4499_08895 [Pseudomonadota bacterium]
MLVPIGIFDDHPDPRVLLLRRAQHQVAARLAHLVDAIVGPASIALSGNVGVAFRGVEEEVVEDHFVEVTRDQPHRALAFGAVGWVLIIERPELPARAAGGERHSAGSLDALGVELALHRLQFGVARRHAVAIPLDIDLIELELRRDAGEILGEGRRVGEPLRVGDGDVDCDAEVLIRPRLNGLRRPYQTQERQDAENPPHRFPPRC